VENPSYFERLFSILDGQRESLAEAELCLLKVWDLEPPDKEMQVSDMNTVELCLFKVWNLEPHEKEVQASDMNKVEYL